MMMPGATTRHLSVKTNSADDNLHDPSDRGIVLSNLDMHSLPDLQETFISASILTQRFSQYPSHIGGLCVGRHRCGLSGIGFDYDHSRFHARHHANDSVACSACDKSGQGEYKENKKQAFHKKPPK